MTVLRYNNVHTRLAAAIDDNDTTITLEAALTEGGVNVPTLAGDTILLGIDDEILELTAYTAGALSGTVTRGYGDTLAAAHDAGAVVANVITKDDVAPPVSYHKRWTDAVSFPATTLTTGVGQTFTNTLLDGTDSDGTGVSWVGASNRFETEVDGRFDIGAYVELACSAATTGEAALTLTVADSGGLVLPGVLGLHIAHLRFGTGADESLSLECSLWLPADTRISGTLVQNSGSTMDWQYAEFTVRRTPT